MKTILINEGQVKKLRSAIKEDYELKQESKPFVVNPDKVLIVKRYLDNGFRKGDYECVGDDGFPQKTPIFSMMSSTGDILKTMETEELVDLLIEKFKKMFSDDNEKHLFFNQVVNDWYNNKIGLFGNLSVNILK
jgi:hypothetical protein